MPDSSIARSEKQNKYAKLLRAISTMGAAFLINLLMQLILMPYITRTVGTDAYGFVTLAKNFTQYATILTMALNSFAARYIAVSWHRGDKEEANVYFSSAFYGNVILATAILAAAIVFIAFLEHILSVPAHLVTDVKLLFLYVFCNFWLVSLFTVFEVAGYIKSKLDITGIFKGLAYLTEAMVLFFLYVMFPAKAFYVGIGMICATLVTAAGNIRICRKHTPDLRIRIGNYSRKAIKTLVTDGIWTSFNALGDNLNSGLDLVICNLLLDAVQMGQVAIAKTVYFMITGIFVILNPAFQPMMLKSYAAHDRETFLNELKTAMKISGMMANVVFAGFVSLGLCFYRLWMPHENVGLIYELTVINLLVLIASGPMQPLYYIYILTLKKKFPCIVTIIGGVFNVAGMLILIRYTSLGVYSVVWTTAVVMMTINFVTNPLYMAHVLELPKSFFYPEIVRNVIACGLVTLAMWGISRALTPGSWPGLILCAVLFAVIGCILHLLVVCSREDWTRIKHALNRFRKVKQ